MKIEQIRDRVIKYNTPRLIFGFLSCIIGAFLAFFSPKAGLHQAENLFLPGIANIVLGAVLLIIFTTIQTRDRNLTELIKESAGQKPISYQSELMQLGDAIQGGKMVSIFSYIGILVASTIAVLLVLGKIHF